MEKLFVYGTLIDPEIQSSIIGRTISGQPDTLHGYVRFMVDFGAASYPMIEPDANNHVAGYILELTPEELKRTDHYETDAYARVQVTLASGQQAWVYTRPSINP